MKKTTLISVAVATVFSTLAGQGLLTQDNAIHADATPSITAPVTSRISQADLTNMANIAKRIIDVKNDPNHQMMYKTFGYDKLLKNAADHCDAMNADIALYKKSGNKQYADEAVTHLYDGLYILNRT
ncbi:hypothetical protein EFL45_10155 [Weissella confusa]|uniref:hypothetical protein n=1 Tax=Weissella confusa TaxID=1583 RepID=UPI00223B6D2E|nr:hypothetical protein [Weissella confusa]MCT0949748.1 hypothetical protein [Weissella confusa]